MKPFTTILLLTACLYHQHLFAQGTQAIGDYCGLEYFYDAAGNRIVREVLTCNVLTSEMLQASDSATTDSLNSRNLQETLFPNPTSGVFNLVFNNAVNDAQLVITDEMGRLLYTGGVCQIAKGCSILV